jgi:hypothetical protein
MTDARDAMLSRMDAARLRPSSEVLPPRSTDDEASKLLDELSRLQSWCVLMARHDPHAVQAADLVQRTRILIVERCKR